MNKYFNVYCYNLLNNYNKSIELILFYYLIINKINCYIIELQFSQPGGKYIFGKNNNWLVIQTNYGKLFINDIN